MYIRPPRYDERQRRKRQKQRWRDRPLLIISVLLHAGLLGALFLLRPPAPPPEPAPSTAFDIVLNGGAPSPTSTGKSTPDAAPAQTEGVPNPAPPAPQQEASLPAAEPPPVPAPMPPPPAEQPEAPATETPPNPAPSTPARPPQVNLSSVPFMPEPVPIPDAPPPLPVPPTPVVPPRLRPRLLPRPQMQARPRPIEPRSPSGFPMPRDWSFSGNPARPAPEGGLGHADVAGPSQPAPLITGAQLGRDWISAYRAWVQARLYYPEQAAANGEDGTAEVVLKINRYGRVESVELVGRSGSMWLDLAIQGLFRGRTVPAFPQGTKEDEATIDQTIQYILRRR